MIKEHDPVVIVGSARTPIGEFLGIFSNVSATQLGATAIKAAILRSKVELQSIESVMMGCVLPAGLGQAPARQAALGAGLSNSVTCTTINKVCGSSMQAVMLAHDLILANTHSICLAGGMENMSKTPYLIEKARTGYRLGHAKIYDHMLLDGLEDAYGKGLVMGAIAEKTAEQYHFSRETQDAYAKESLKRAQVATEQGLFLSDVEITPTPTSTSTSTIDVKNSERNSKGKSDTSIMVDKDEHPQKVRSEKISLLKPSFKENGTITPANSSAISDGAAALLLMKHSLAKKLGLKPLAKILGFSSYANEPSLFPTAPIPSIKLLLKKLNWQATTPDLYEINEAFAVVVLAAMKELQISHDKINIHGGACALGHPIGASGARILCTLLGALKAKDKTLGIASLCIGGGEATSIAIERLN